MTVLDRPPTSPEGSDPGAESGGTRLLFGALLAIAGLGVLVTVTGLLVMGVIAVIQDDPVVETTSSISSELDISLSEFAIQGELAAPAGNVTLNVVNGGAIDHNLVIRELGARTANLSSRGVETLDLGELEPGTYEVFCDIPGHADSGMEAELVITEPDDFMPADLEGEHGNLTPEEMDQLMVDSMLAYPAETEGKATRSSSPRSSPTAPSTSRSPPR